jgi:methylmalonyl-CoA mutase N-terminal domain/subunit
MTQPDKRIENEKERWAPDTVEPFLDRFPERKDLLHTSSEIPVERLYTPKRWDPEYLVKQGFPGEYPFTRGVQPTLYRGRYWTMRQYAGFGSAAESNERFKYLLEKGQTGISVAFDLPTQIGYDADDSLAEGEVGRVGVSISTLDDMEILLAGIPLEKVSISMTINATAAILLAMVVALAKRRGVPVKALRGTIQNDILKEYVARGTYIFPPAPSMRLITDVFDYCTQEIPRWNTISVSGYHIREAGSTAAQEIAFTLANGMTYVQAAVERGLDIDSFAGQISFFFNVHNNFLEEIAKFRAARRLWARIMRHRLGAKDPKSWRLRFHTQTAGSTLTAHQPENNVVRVAIQALAATLGGTQSLHTNSRDEALSLPTEDSARIALRTQQVIAYESGIADTIDPLAGSYFMEYLTDELEKRAEEYIAEIDQMGGMLGAIESGYVQREIQEAAYTFQKDLERGETVTVGVNQFAEEEDTPIALLEIDPSIGLKQRERLAELRDVRDPADVERRLDAVKTAAVGDENLMPIIIQCVENQITLGEICGALRKVWGEYQPVQTV